MGGYVFVGRVMIAFAVLLGTACATWLGDELGPWTAVPILVTAALAGAGISLTQEARDGR